MRLWSRQRARLGLGTRSAMPKRQPSGDLGQGPEGLGPGGSILDGEDLIAAEVEEIVDPDMGREEALGLAG